MASGRIILSYSLRDNVEASVTVRVTMTYYGNGETYNLAPSANNCRITLNGTTKYFTHSYTTSSSAQDMGFVDFNIAKTHNSQSLTATGTITNYSTYYSNPTATCTISISSKTSYVVSYNANGRGTAPAQQTKWYNETLTLQPAMSYSGWTFMGWGISSGTHTATYPASGPYSENGATTLYAIWKKDITLSYDANGGIKPSGLHDQETTIYNTETSTSFTIESDPDKQPTRSNYNFLGWAETSDGAAIYQPGDTISNISDNKTLYAVWELAYIPSQIINIVAYRSNSSGGNDDSGTYGYLSFEVTKFNGGGVLAYPTVTASYLDGDDEISIDLTPHVPDDGIYEVVFGEDSLDGDTQYPITITVTDSKDETIYGSYTASTFISTTHFTIDINETGTAIGLLTTAPNSGVDIGGDISAYDINASGDINATGTISATIFDGEVDWSSISNKPFDNNDMLNTANGGTGRTSGFAWTQIGTGTNTTSAISFAVEGHTVTTENYNEIMVVADTERNSAYHLFTVIIPQQRISTTAREVKLSGGEGSTTSTNCGAWGKITTTDFAPTGVWINNTTYTSSTTWYIYGR